MTRLEGEPQHTLPDTPMGGGGGFGSPSRRVIRKWFADPGVYPVYASVVAGVALSAFYMGRIMFQHPQVYVSKNEREKIVRTRDETPYTEHVARRHSHTGTSEVFPNANRASKYMTGYRDPPQEQEHKGKK